jgi:hypothetical protein
VAPDPSRGEHTSKGEIQKPRRVAVWLLAVGLLILVGLLGYRLNQQRLSKQPSDVAAVEGTQREAAPAPVPEVPPSETTRRSDPGTLKPKTALTRAVYMVTHKHRLRDCHGTLTFTRNRLRFDSDEPQDSFEVGRGDVSIDGEVLRIRDKPWRFEFSDGVRAERLFSDWKAGTLPPVPAP